MSPETHQKVCKMVANWLINDVLGWLKKNKLTIEQFPIAPEFAFQMFAWVAEGYGEKNRVRKMLLKFADENLAAGVNPQIKGEGWK